MPLSPPKITAPYSESSASPFASPESPVPRLNFGQQPPAAPDAPPDMETAYAAWRTAPSTQTMSSVLTAADPYISRSIQRHLRTSDPVAKGRAKALLAKALPRYDDRMASLPTFIDRQLQPLIRWQAQRHSVVKVTDRMRTESASLARAEKELNDELGREPSTRQLADYTGLPASRIEKIRKSTLNVVPDSHVLGEGADGVQAEAGDMAVDNDQEAFRSWVRFVQSDLGDIDQAILSHTLGLDGAAVLSNKDLAKRLMLSPGAISQRKARIQQILDRGPELNVFG
jgi:DNA-directed RNA polymerase specialized sigma subunit